MSDLSWLREGARRRFMAKAPICRRCKDRIYLRQLGVLLATFGIVALIYWLFQPLFLLINSPTLRRLVTMGTLLVCIAPVWVWEVLRPAAFDVSTTDGAVDYEFRDAEVAIEFAFANRHAEWMKLDGEPFDPQGMIDEKYAELMRGDADQPE
jgi:hypothetical protein